MRLRAIYSLGAILFLEAGIIWTQLRLLEDLRSIRDIAENVRIVRRQTRELADRKEHLSQTARTTVYPILQAQTFRALTPDEQKLYNVISAEKNSQEYKRLIRIEEFAELRLRFGPLIRRLKLDANRANELLKLLSDEQNLGLDINATAMAQHLSMDEVRKGISTSKNALQEVIEATVGSENVCFPGYFGHALGVMVDG